MPMRSRRGGKTDAQDGAFPLRGFSAVRSLYFGCARNRHQEDRSRAPSLRPVLFRLFRRGAIRSGLGDVLCSRLSGRRGRRIRRLLLSAFSRAHDLGHFPEPPKPFGIVDRGASNADTLDKVISAGELPFDELLLFELRLSARPPGDIGAIDVDLRAHAIAAGNRAADLLPRELELPGNLSFVRGYILGGLSVSAGLFSHFARGL